MRTLAVDTAGQFGSLALVEDGQIVAEQMLFSPEGFGSLVFLELQQLLKRHEWELASIQAFAAASGPGSFTGVRVGLTAVKGLAEAMGKPAYGASNLKALARKGTAPLRATVIDARRGEVYGAVYDADLNPVVNEEVLPFPAWLASLPKGSFEILSTGFAPFQASLAGTQFENVPVTEHRALAGAVGQIAETLHCAGEAGDPAMLDANYVRRSDAELMWKEP